MLSRKDRGARTDKYKCCGDNCFKTSAIGVEYVSPNQRGGIFGTIYTQFFGTSLPAALTTGDNVSRLIDCSLLVEDGDHRYMYDGWAQRESDAAGIYLSGTTGHGNLALSIIGVTLIEGWVEYCK